MYIIYTSIAQPFPHFNHFPQMPPVVFLAFGKEKAGRWSIDFCPGVWYDFKRSSRDKRASYFSALPEQAELEARVTALEAEVKAIDEKNAPSIAKLVRQLKNVLPEEEAVEAQRKVIDDLFCQRGCLGLFKGKEKKAIDARIQNEETPKLEELKTIAAAKRIESDKALNAQISALRDENKEQRKELQAAQNRIKEIKTERTKNR